MGKYSDHNAYYYGEEEVASVTTILKVLNKPTLVKWANSLGFRRQSVDDVLEESSVIGTYVHTLLYAHLMKKDLLWCGQKHVSKSLLVPYIKNFREWKENNEIEPIFMEKKFSCDKFGGTVDFYGIINGKKTILDFKTSKSFQMTMFLQLSAYKYMLELENYEVEQVAIMRVNVDRIHIKIMTAEEVEKYFKLFNSLVDTFYNNYELEKEWKKSCQKRKIKL